MRLVTRKFDSENTKSIFILDDFPQNIEPGPENCIYVPPYYKDISGINFIRNAEWWDTETETEINELKPEKFGINVIPSGLLNSTNLNVQKTAIAIYSIIHDYIKFPVARSTDLSDEELYIFEKISSFLKSK